MNFKIGSINTEQKALYVTPPGTGKDLPSGINAESVIKKARTMLSLQDKMNLRAMNLIQMAERALENGNPASANEFAGKVLLMLSIKKPSDPDISLPDTMAVKKEKQREYKKEQTEPGEHTYMDSSNDPGVSFSYPGKLSGPESFVAVPAHEYEHVRRSLREAVLNGERVMTVVSYRVRYDPATGEPYMAGGVTRTIRYPDIPAPEKGKKVDIYA